MPSRPTVSDIASALGKHGSPKPSSRDKGIRPTRSPPTFSSLPVELKVLITSFLGTRDVASLCVVSRSWSTAAEMTLWGGIDLVPAALRQEAVGRPRDRYGRTPQLSPSTAEILLRHIKEFWANIHQAIIRRPERLALIKSFHCIAMSSYWDEICSTIPHIAPTLTSLHLFDVSFPELGRGCAFDVIDIVRTLPHLRVLHIDFQEQWYIPLVSVLRAVPTLEELSISVETEQGNVSPPPEHDLLPDLPRLRKFSMNCCESLFRFLPRLANRARDLRHLEAYQHGYELTPRHIECIKPFVNLETLKISDPIVFWEDDGANADGDILPKLRTLLIGDRWSPEMIPRHPGVEHLEVSSSATCASSPVGSLPKANETGRLFNWVAEGLIEAPNLLTITNDGLCVHSPDGTPHPRARFIIRTFTSSDANRALFHVRSESEGSDRHSRMYISDQLAYRTSEDVGQYDADDYGSLGEGAPMSVDWTHFQGWPLPVCLVDYVYDSIGEDRHGATGKRGIPLPDEVWEVLEGWREQVEAQDRLI